MAQLIGLFRLGRDAEVRQTPGGDSVANLALAYNYGSKAADGKKPSQWIDASLFGKRADALAQYLTKGTQIAATIDDVHVRTYDKKDGAQGVALSGKVSAIEFAGGGQKSEAKPPERPQRATAKPASDDPFIDDDLPF